MDNFNEDKIEKIARNIISKNVQKKIDQHPIDDSKKSSFPMLIEDIKVEEVSYDDITIIKAMPISKNGKIHQNKRRNENG